MHENEPGKPAQPRRPGEGPSGGAPGAEPEPAPRPPASSADPAGLKRLLELAGLVIAPPTVVTALAFYFGWTLTNARSLYFGIDPSTLAYSTQDYLLRSADALFVPLGALVVTALAALAVHRRVTRLLREDRAPRTLEWVARAAALSGAILLAYGVAAVFWPQPLSLHYLVAPLSPGAGAALLAYAAFLRRRLTLPDRAIEAPDGLATSPLALTLVALLVLLSLFWATSEYAQALGRGRAEALERALGSRPEAIVTSSRRLHLSAPSVTETRIPARGEERPSYRYEGLRLLVRSGGSYVLVPEDWSRRDGVAVLLPEDDAVLLEFRAGG